MDKAFDILQREKVLGIDTGTGGLDICGSLLTATPAPSFLSYSALSLFVLFRSPSDPFLSFPFLPPLFSSRFNFRPRICMSRPDTLMFASSAVCRLLSPFAQNLHLADRTSFRWYGVHNRKLQSTRPHSFQWCFGAAHVVIIVCCCADSGLRGPLRSTATVDAKHEASRGFRSLSLITF